MMRPVRIRGVSASIGVAVGPANLVVRGRRAPVWQRLRKDDVVEEVQRFMRAVAASRDEIERARDALTDQHGSSYTSIFDVYLLMHGDALLIDATTRLIRDERLSAQWALGRVVEDLKAPLLGNSSAYFQERAHDIDHVQEHLLRHLAGEVSLERPSVVPSVLFAHDLTPADAVHLLAPPTLGLVTEMGGTSSHTAILARAFGIPAVAGTGPLPVAVEEDEIVVVDGFSGEVTLGADAAEQRLAEARRDRFQSFLSSERAANATTKDGTDVAVGANIELPAEIESAIARGAEGVGLYRTEFMCLDRAEPPDEESQVELYRRVAAALSPNRVVFRTFDFRDDKRLHTALLEQREQDWLRTQIRSVLQAQDAGTVSLMFPMVGALHELHRGRSLVAECAEELGLPQPKVGMMVEVPSAALSAARFAEHADFFAIGTNDLVQYTLGIDRRDYHSAALASPLHPAVLKLIEATVSAADDAGVPCSMCGDMAADPIGLALALGLGLRDVSVPVTFIPLAREVVRAVDLAVVRDLAKEAMIHETPHQVRQLAVERLGEDIEALWRELGVD
ncbi:MAG: phosphoenolpyruvate--protein phosphotransferase [Myxococcota bacterium]